MPTSARKIPSSLRLMLLPAGLAVLLLWAAGAPPLLAADQASHDDVPAAAGCDCGLPVEADAPFLDLNWSLALRGAYVLDEQGAHFEGSAAPSVTLSHLFVRGGYDLTARAEIVATGLDGYRLAALGLSASGEYRLDAVTGVAASLDLSLTQDPPDPPGIPAGVASAPLIGSGAAEVAVSRDIGPLDATVRGTASRTVYGTSTRNDGTIVDNSAQDTWTAGGGFRLGYKVTPILTAFVDGSAEYEFFDQPSPVYLVKLDAVDYALRTGLAARWSSVLEAEASIGLGLRRFADPGFADVVSTLYDASLTFRPDETLSLGASLSTSVGAPGADAAGLARVEYAAAADARYQVNPWLALRGSAGWSYATLAGATTTETAYNAGAGLDYLFNLSTTLAADYAYSWSGGSADPAGEAEHRVTLGVTFAKPEGTLQ